MDDCIDQDFTGEVFDDDGYPTEEFLGHIEHWDCVKKPRRELLRFAMLGHIYPEYWDVQITTLDGKDKEVWNISTGGWSGNESIIYSLKSNNLFWIMSWVQSRRGGHYIFEVPAG